MSYRSKRRGISLLAGCVLSCLAATAMADDTLAISNSLYSIAPNPDETRGGEWDFWRYAVGAGVVSMPTFPGARGTKVEGLPIFSVGYGRWFFGANPDAGSLVSLGAYLYHDAHWRAGVAVTYDFIEPRQESDDSHLRGLGDVKRTTHFDAFGVFTYDWFTARSSVLTDIGDNQRGTTVTLDTMGKYSPTEQWTLSAGPGVTWGSDQYNTTYFGVNAEQSVRSGLPPYSLGSGVNEVRFSVGAAYHPTPHWNIGADITAAWIENHSGDSPIVQKKNQMTYGLLVTYLFF
ncbi:MipA/OmpV family protein [Dyella sp. Tek66A03]|jgi:outer membrane protein|uniref:MipA/OmpV family protein n=1 Tax=Dyella sp. Tek66A03 TaxID=3458298 RepID=UPI0031B8C60C